MSDKLIASAKLKINKEKSKDYYTAFDIFQATIHFPKQKNISPEEAENSILFDISFTEKIKEDGETIKYRFGCSQSVADTYFGGKRTGYCTLTKKGDIYIYQKYIV